MRLKLGLPDMLGSAPLARRLAGLTAARLLLLSLSLSLVGVFYLRGKFGFGSFTMRVVLTSFGLSFALTGVYAALLRRGRHLERLAEAQLVLDQITWTVIAYLTGGAASGATSFYGLSCLVGASLMGLRGATLAALSGAVTYGALVFALQRGFLSSPPDQPPSIYHLSSDELTFYLLVNLLVLIVVALLAGTLADRLRWTGGALVAATERADQAERMAGLGRLAAGLAHEIRNPLSSIAGSIQLLRAGKELDEEDRQLCEIIQSEANRLNDLVTDMMDLSKPRKPELAVIDAATVAREVVAVSVTNEAEGVALSVVDHGVGIEEAQMSRLFDAFFTTRSQGSGVGLAVVKRIADEHGFLIHVTSEAGRGASFRVLMGPAVQA